MARTDFSVRFGEISVSHYPATGFLEADPAATAYIGDSLTDLEAATAAGVRPGAVLWSKKPEEVEAFTRESRARGAFVLRDPAELRALAGSAPAGDSVDQAGT